MNNYNLVEIKAVFLIQVKLIPAMEASEIIMMLQVFKVLFLLLLFLLYSARHQQPNASCTNEVCELRYKPLLDDVTNIAFVACVFVCPTISPQKYPA